MESISPVLPSVLFSILPDDILLAIAERSAGNRLIIGAAMVAVLRKSRLFMCVVLRLNANNVAILSYYQIYPNNFSIQKDILFCGI
jgi:hypothetical protein